ncbi:penicillin-binding protein [Metarhizium brunneum]
MKAEFHRIREDNPGIDPRPLGVYCGRYRNVLGNFFIEIRQSLKDAHLLELLFLGREEQMYQLRHLQGDMFEWAPDYDEQARRARFTAWDTAYFQIGFHFKDEDEASSLEWAGAQTLVALHQSQSVARDGLINNSGNSNNGEL